MATLLFYEDSHRYTVDGEEVPSVSELTRFITRELYSDAPQYVLEQAAKRGTTIHKATEALDKFGNVEVDSEIAPYVQAYINFIKEVNPEWSKIEWAINNGNLYAGTLDRYGKVKGVPAIIDIKSTKNISGLHKIAYTAQLNLYRMALPEETKVEALYILQLKQDGTYKLIPIEIEDELANACISLHTAIQKTKRRKRKVD